MNLHNLHRWLYVQLDNLPRAAWFALLDSVDHGVRAVTASPLTGDDPAAALIAVIAVTPQAYTTIFMLAVHALARVCCDGALSNDTRDRAREVAGLLEAENRDSRATTLLCALDGKAPARAALTYRTRYGGLQPKLPSCFSAEGLQPREHMFYFVLCRLVWLQADPWGVPRDDPRVSNVVRSYTKEMGSDPLEEVDAARRPFYAVFQQHGEPPTPIAILRRVTSF